MCEKTVRVISFFCIAALVAQESNPLLGPLPTGSQNREESDGRHFSKQIPPTPPAFAKKKYRSDKTKRQQQQQHQKEVPKTEKSCHCF
ncbi:hypothetical protein CEXT_190811 [Caerostris extrusa]|uniref:Secreted protein n=1 Tax=Caerostris extrusa TaxID=172846 RepID=A0AAV4VVL3_CAEEX|nr:hypothetical protein CEXT_190811 [Caerostris extrusa]